MIMQISVMPTPDWSRGAKTQAPRSIDEIAPARGPTGRIATPATPHVSLHVMTDRMQRAPAADRLPVPDRRGETDVVLGRVLARVERGEPAADAGIGAACARCCR